MLGLPGLPDRTARKSELLENGLLRRLKVCHSTSKYLEVPGRMCLEVPKSTQQYFQVPQFIQKYLKVARST